MLFDNEMLFSNHQAITGSGASTNAVDLGQAKDLGPGNPVPVEIQVTETFNNLTDLAVALQADDNSAFSSPKTVATSGPVALADLVAGFRFAIDYLPRGTDERFLRLSYTVTGVAPTAGKVIAGVVAGHQTNRGNV